MSTTKNVLHALATSYQEAAILFDPVVEMRVAQSAVLAKSGTTRILATGFTGSAL